MYTEIHIYEQVLYNYNTTPFANFASVYMAYRKIRLQILMSVYFYDITILACYTDSEVSAYLAHSQRLFTVVPNFTVYACSRIRDLAFTLMHIILLVWGC